MKDALIVTALSLVPRNRGARGMGLLARLAASRFIAPVFARVYGLNLDEAEHPIGQYPTLEALFTRKLKPGARPICADDDALVSPVDGTLARAGRTDGQTLELPGGRRLSIAALLGEPFDGERDVLVLYLSPRDYHRVHVPREGQAVAWRYTPGTLWPVFPAAVRRIDDLFAKNERLSVQIATDRGPLHAVLVGAFGVGRITSPVCDLVSNTGAPAAAATLDPPVPLARGGELGVFHLGSTVVLVLPPGQLTVEVAEGAPVQMGARLGAWRLPA